MFGGGGDGRRGGGGIDPITNSIVSLTGRETHMQTLRAEPSLGFRQHQQEMTDGEERTGATIVLTSA